MKALSILSVSHTTTAQKIEEDVNKFPFCFFLIEDDEIALLIQNRYWNDELCPKTYIS